MDTYNLRAVNIKEIGLLNFPSIRTPQSSSELSKKELNPSQHVTASGCMSHTKSVNIWLSPLASCKKLSSIASDYASSKALLLAG